MFAADDEFAFDSCELFDIYRVFELSKATSGLFLPQRKWLDTSSNQKVRSPEPHHFQVSRSPRKNR